MRCSFRISELIRHRGISQRWLPASRSPPANRMSSSTSDGQRTATHFAPNCSNSTGPMWAGRSGIVTLAVAWLSAAVAVINTWNRIAAPFQYAPPIPRHTIQPAHEPAQV